MKCGNCEKEVSSDASFCGHCGFSLTPQICPECNRENPSNVKFCEQCGQPLQAEIPRDEPVSTSPPLPQDIRCPSCGISNFQGAKFCQQCGTALGMPFEDANVQPIQPARKKRKGPHPLLWFVYGILGTISVLALIYIALVILSVF
jgi:uncharacterized membrane protein YvbJ